MSSPGSPDHVQHCTLIQRLAKWIAARPLSPRQQRWARIRRVSGHSHR